MSIQAIAWAWKQKLSCPKKMVLLALADCADIERNCYPSIRHLVEVSGLSKSGVVKALNDLSGLGLVIRVRRKQTNKRHASTQYFLNMPPPSQTKGHSQKDEPCSVYVVRANAGIKIGISKDVDGRIKSFIGSGAVNVELVGTIETTRTIAIEIEKNAHKAFEKHRTQGEWFDIHADAAFSAVKDLEALHIVQGCPSDEQPIVRDVDSGCPSGKQRAVRDVDNHKKRHLEPSRESTGARAGEILMISPDTHPDQWTAWLAHFEREKDSKKASLMKRTARREFRSDKFAVPSEWPPVEKKTAA